MDAALSITLRLLLVVTLVLLNGLFVAAEFAIVTARRSRLEDMAQKGNPVAKFTLRATKDLNNYLAACQLGITVVSLQALANFLFIPVQPWWAFTVILIDLWIIHSLFVHRREYV